MSPRDRAQSVDPQSRHQHSASESGRLSVPMWDSSDPERAPPPLPLNPGTHTPSSSPVKANTSATVAAAAQALVERARENLAAQYVTNPPPERLNPERLMERSPERPPARSPAKSPHPQHRRLQSLQTNSSRDFRQPGDKRPSRSTTPVSESDTTSISSSRSTTPTPVARNVDFQDGSPNKELRRPASQPLMLENTPPAISPMASPPPQNTEFSGLASAALADVTNNATPRTQKNFESIHSQMLNLTKIANSLQKEMAALSRRSKDNATDLVALKDVTNKRDEDIRTSLRDLANGQKSSETRLSRNLIESSRSNTARPSSAMSFTRNAQDDKPPASSTYPRSPYTLPRLLSSESIETQPDHERPSSPGARCVDATPSMAMLEKIIRDMGTKDDQDRVLETLTTLVERSGRESTTAIRTVIDMIESMRDQSSKALVKHDSRRRRSASIESLRGTNDRQAIARSVTSQPQSQPAPNIVNDEVLKVLQKIKDSVLQSGGMTGEVKSLIKELRGEVLGMGREIGRKLDGTGRIQSANRSDNMSRQELSAIIEDNLADLRAQMESIIQTRRRDSTSSALSRTTVDSSEVYAVVKHALSERGLDASQTLLTRQQGLDADAILNAVKEAYEAYKPEVEVQQFGLERDEILQCLREGLEDYQTNKHQPQDSGINRDEVMAAVQEAVQTFQPPRPTSEAAEIKQEVMEAFRESLEEFKAAEGDNKQSRDVDASRNEVLDAVREGFGIIRKEGAREIEISPDDLHEAVRAGLNNMDNPFGAYGTQVISSLHEIVDGMRVEFKQYSEANGRDTEQVLDAMKDGLESLRAEVESYVDRAQDVTGRDEIISTLHQELDGLRSSFDNFTAQKGNSDAVSDRSELAAFIKTEFDNLQEVIASQAHAPETATQHKHDILHSLERGFSQLQAHSPVNSGSRGLEDSNEEQLEALKMEFEQLREAILSGTAAHKDELMEQIRESMDRVPDRMSSSRGLGNEQNVVEALRDELNGIRDSLQAPALYNGDSTSSDSSQIVGAIQESMASIRAQLSAEQNESATETLGVIREELDSFRAAIGGSLMLSTPGVDKDAIMEAVRESLGSVNLQNANTGAVKEELEKLRQSFSNAMVHSGGSVNQEEIIEAVRSALDDLKMHLGSQVTVAGTATGAVNEETLGNISNSITGLRTDVSRLHDKPVDMTVSYEILDTLKDGLSNIRFDLDRLKAGNEEIVLAGAQQRETQNASSGPLKKADIERFEVLLSQLQIKVEAMDQNMQNQPEISIPDAATKADIGTVEASLREIQVAIAGLAAAERTGTSPGVSKDDVDALETLMQNTKAKLEERIIPGLEATVTRDQLDGVEAVVRMTNDAVDVLTAKMDNAHSSKDDLAGVALLISDATTSLNDIKERLSLADFTDIASKESVESIEELCDGIKSKLEDMPSDVPSRSDIEELNELISDMKDAHNSMRERYEGDINVTAQAFDDRKQEALKISEQIEDLKGFIEETRDHLKSRMKRGNEDVRALDDILQTIEEKIDDVPNQMTAVDDLKDAFKSEFSKAHAALEDLKIGHDSNSSVIVDKFLEHRSSIISEISQKLDERFQQIMSSHDEEKRVLGDATSAMNEKAAQHGDLLAGNQAVAADLKITIDTLGAAVTGIAPALEETTSKITEDCQTVFSKVEDVASKLDEATVDSKTNHQLTREDITKALTAIDGLHQQASVSHPEVMTALKTLSAIVEQHFEHAKTSQEHNNRTSNDMKAHIDEGLKRLPVPQIDAPREVSGSSVQFDNTRIHGKLDELLGRGLSTQFDDSHIRGKLDELLGHATKPSASPEQLDRLEQVHQQVTATAAEISAFVAFQTKLITSDQESKSREADQAALDLSKCLSEKESVEADISALSETKESLTAEVNGLKSERDQLMAQKSHLSADVSSLETALRIRREELQMMDQRADALERRIIDGVMDHSRALLMTTKQPRNNPPNMNLKRVNSNRSTATASTTTQASVLNAGVDMAIKARADRQKRASVNPSSRRIASLNQINSNVPAGGKNLVSATPKNTGLVNLKRSQSTRNPALRKASWNPQEHGSLGGLDKENDILGEEEEEESDSEHDRHAVARSTSLGGRSQGTALSYLTSTDLDRRVSYGSTVRSALGPRSSLAASIHEEEEEDDVDDDDTSSVRQTRDEETGGEWQGEDGGQKQLQIAMPEEHAYSGQQQQQQQPAGDFKGLVLRKEEGYHTDSGLGSDLPTALTAELGSASDYFK